MSGHHITHATWPRRSAKSGLGEGTAFSLPLKLGPYRIAEARFDLVTLDFGVPAMSEQEVDARCLPLDQALYLRSVPDHADLVSSPILAPLLVYKAYSYDRSWVATEGSFESYLASFSRTSRKGLKRRSRQLIERSGGRLDVRRFDQADQMSMFHQDARFISAKTFQERLMDEGLPNDPSFLDEIKVKASGGQCYGTILYLDDQPISFLFCRRDGLGWLAVFGGFDPDYASFSPGTVHLLSELEASFQDPSSAFFDFGPGPSGYKQFFSTHDVPCSDILILDKTKRNRLAIETHRLLGLVSEKGGRMAAALRLKERMRQMIRGR